MVSGTNIKTINGNSILGAGNIVIEGGGGDSPTPDVIINVGNNNYTTTPTSFSYTFEKGDYLLLKNLCKSKRYDKIKITQFGIASGCDEDSFWWSFTKSTATYTYRFTDISANTINIQLIVTGTITLNIDYNYGAPIIGWDAYYTPETYKSVIESIIGGYVTFVYMIISNGVPGNRYIFSAFESYNNFNTSFNAITTTGRLGGGDSIDVRGINITFTSDNVVFKRAD